jgi:hypothetical protein
MKTIYGRRNILSSVSFFSGDTAFLQRVLFKNYFQEQITCRPQVHNAEGGCDRRDGIGGKG